MVERRRPGQPAGITHARVVAEARELLTEEGVDGLTMRALAHRLGVAPNALYTHVRTKAQLVDDVLDDLLAGVTAIDPDDPDWRGALHALMRSSHAVLLEHAELVPLFLARRGARETNAQRLGESMLRLLATGGVEGRLAREAQRALIVYTIGSAAFAARPPLGSNAETEALPSVDELTRNFDQGLAWLLAGIARA